MSLNTAITYRKLISFYDMSLFSFVACVFFIPFSLIRPFLQLTISDLLLFVSIGFSFIDVVIKRKKIRKHHVFHLFLFPSYLIVIGGLISSFALTGNTQSSLIVLAKIIFVFAFIPFNLSIILTEKKQVDCIINAFLFGCALSAFVAVVDYLLGTHIGPSVAYNGVYTLSYGSAGRYSGITSHPNFQGYYLAICMPIVFDKFLHNEKRKFFSIFQHLFLLILFLWGMVLSGSMSSLGGAIVGVSSILLFQSLDRKKRLVTLILVLLILLSFTFVYFFDNLSSLYEEFLHMALNSRNFSRVYFSTYQGRKDANALALLEMSKHPFVGVGLDQFSQERYAPIDRFGDPHGVHNAFIRAYLGGGIVTLLGYLWIYSVSLATSLKLGLHFLKGIRFSNQLGLMGAIIAFTVIDMAQPGTHIRISWILCCLSFFLVNRLNNIRFFRQKV